MARSGKKLAVALLSQQDRLKAKQKAAQASFVAEHRVQRNGQPARGTLSLAHTACGSKANLPTRGRSSLNSKRKNKTVASTCHKATIPFKITDKILLIGEGNFSYARALVVDPPAHLSSLPANNITATAYDSEEDCYSKYTDAQAIVSTLREKGVEVIFNVDGTRLEKITCLKGRTWNRIVWNFPHSGKGITDQDRNIRENQILILGFLRSASMFLKRGAVPVIHVPRKKKTDDDDYNEEVMPADTENFISNDDAEYEFYVAPPEDVKVRGTILVTVRNVVPYTQWDIPHLAKQPPSPLGSASKNPRYTILRSFKFHRHMWKGYEHCMTKGERAHGTGKTGEGGEDRTWEFCIRDDSEE